MFSRPVRGAGALAMAALLAMGTAACGDDDDTASTTATSADTTGDAESEGAAAIDIKMVDYGFDISGPVVAGGTIRLSNAGKEFHMLGLGKIKDGKSFEDVTETVKKLFAEGGEEGGEGEESPSTTEAGAGASTTAAATEGEDGEGEGGEGEDDPFAEVMDDPGQPSGIMGPGQSAEITVPDLAAGDYALICFIPKEGGGPPHGALGMISELKVTEGDAPTITPTETYTLEAGKPVQGPAELKAGKHTFKFEAKGDKAGDLEPILVKPKDGKTFADIDKVFDSWEESLPAGAGDMLPGELTFGLFDLLDDHTIYVSVDLKPGTYELIGGDTDVDDGPPLPVERLVLKVT